MDVDVATHAMLRSATAMFHELGAELLPVKFPDAEQTVKDWVANCAIETATAHAESFDLHRSDYGAVLAAVIEHGRSVMATDYQQILLRRMDFRGRVTALFQDIDLLLVPVQPMSPLTLTTIRTLGEQPDLIERLQRYTCPFDMTGHPTITLPGGRSETDMPMGFQLVAAASHEHSLVRAGAAFQSATDWHRRRPVL
jgi:amidase